MSTSTARVADLAKSPSSPFCVQKGGRWRCPLYAAFWVLSLQKGRGAGGPGGGGARQGQAEVSPCNTLQSGAHHGRHIYNWDHWVLSTSI